MKRKKKFEYKLEVPKEPTWIRRDSDPRFISIWDIPVVQLRKLGKAWTNNLIERRKKGISGKFIKSV